LFRHVVLLKWADSATPAQKQAVLEGLATMPGAIPEIRSYRFGPDAGAAEGNHDVAVVADFDDKAGYLVYASHPAHVALITERIRPILAARAAVQYEVS
jgi:Stress responsive A/B Barrel Domain